MLIIVPMMFFTTIAMTFLFLSQITSEELDITHTLANDFTLVHEYRVELADTNNINTGSIDALPGYPFQHFYNYHTEIVDTDEFVAILTWPDQAIDSIDLPDNNKDLLRIIEARLHRGYYAGNWINDEDRDLGGRLVNFSFPDMPLEPMDGSPVLLKITFKGESQ